MRAAPIPVYSLRSRPFGQTYGEWSATWWQWLLSIPKSRNPLDDPTGVNAHLNQKYQNIFFLCQTHENTVPHIPSRTVTLPAGVSIFMPIINWISILNIDGVTDQELTEVANKRMDEVGNLEITINGLNIRNGLEEYRSLSPFFEVWLPENNIIGSRPGMVRAVSDGYWLFLKPLKSDTTISSFGSCSSGLTKIGVNYNLYIEQKDI
jgi:hypothetical protein